MINISLLPKCKECLTLIRYEGERHGGCNSLDSKFSDFNWKLREYEQYKLRTCSDMESIKFILTKLREGKSYGQIAKIFEVPRWFIWHAVKRVQYRAKHNLI